MLPLLGLVLLLELGLQILEDDLESLFLPANHSIELLFCRCSGCFPWSLSSVSGSFIVIKVSSANLRWACWLDLLLLSGCSSGVGLLHEILDIVLLSLIDAAV